MTNIALSSQILDPQTTGFLIKGNAVNDQFGTSVSNAGDVNQDGYDDMIIGASGKDGKGGAYVIFGGEKASRSNIDLSGTLTTGFFISGSNTNDRTGHSVGAADINNDGVSDIIIGSWGENSNTGAAYALMYYFCEANCLVCPSSLICSVCSPGYVLLGTSCQPCATNCEICIAPGGCETCFSSYLFYEAQCFNSCPERTFPSSSNGEDCQNCPTGCYECTSLSACQACVKGYTLSGSKCNKIQIKTEENEEKTGEKVAAGAFEGTSLAGAALGSGSSLPLNFGLVAKILRNIKYMSLPVSQELYETFVSWKVASGFMSAPGSWSQKYSSKGLPTVFSRYGLQSAFLINFWKPFVMTLIGIALFAVFKAVEASMKTKKKSMISKISRQINVAASNFALTQFYSNLDDVLFYLILEMRSTKFETGFRICSSILAIVLFLLGGLFMLLHSKILGRYQKVKEASSTPQLEDFVSRFVNISLIFKDFKDTNSLTQSFLIINIGRSVLASLIFATLFEYPMIQISFLIVLNLLMIVYLWNLKSFQEFMNTCGQMFCEGVLFIANICVFLLALFDHAESYPKTEIENIGKCIIVLNLILLFGCALLLVISLGKTLYQSYLAKKKGQQQVKQPPLPADKKVFTSAKFLRPPNTDFFKNDLSQQAPKLERNSKLFHQKELSNNYSTQSPSLFPQTDSFEIPISNQTEDFADKTPSNMVPNQMYPRSRLLRNRQITQARIDETSRLRANSTYNNNDEGRNQDSSFHSRIALNQEHSIMDQDISLMNFDPHILRGEQYDLVPRRRAQTMKK